MKHIKEEYCYCDGAGTCNGCNLFTCKVCKASEGELTTECCGYELGYASRTLCYHGFRAKGLGFDFKNGNWEVTYPVNPELGIVPAKATFITQETPAQIIALVFLRSTDKTNHQDITWEDDEEWQKDFLRHLWKEVIDTKNGLRLGNLAKRRLDELT